MQSSFHYRLPLAAATIAGFVVGLSANAQAAASLDTLYSFCAQSGCPDGDQPYAGITFESANKLIGTTGFGGKYNGGTVFALDDKQGSWKHKNLKSFCAGTPPSCPTDQGPSVTLVLDKSGNIYGTVYFGGTNSDGAVFEMKSKGGNKYALHYIHSFDGSDGNGPWDLSYAGQNTGARYDGASPLYGVTLTGGTNDSGTVYSLTPGKNGWTFQTLYNFCSATNCSDGGYPRGAVFADTSGALYGTTGYAGADNAGTIYKLTSSNGTWSENTLYTFCSQTNCTDGNGPFAGLAQDSSGNFYGTTYFGGNANEGVAFELAANGTYSVLYSFCAQTNCTDGSYPASAVTLDSKGDIFGITSRGGDTNFGAMFEITGGTYTQLFSFCNCSNGGYPYGTLALDSSGRIYGTTQAGGQYGLGSVYQLTP